MACNTVCGSPRNGYGARHIFRVERLNRAQDACPALLPPAHYVGLRGRAAHFKLAIAKAVRLFAIAGEEVGEARAHIARQMLYKNSDGVRLRIERQKKVIVTKLRHRA